jgi:hypothetical protein
MERPRRGKTSQVEKRLLDVTNDRLCAVIEVHMFNSDKLGSAISQPTQCLDLSAECFEKARRRPRHHCQVSVAYMRSAQPPSNAMQLSEARR